MLGAAADLLVGREEEAERRAGGRALAALAEDIVLAEEVLGQLHDHGHAGLVVGAEERRAVARDEGVASVLCERRLPRRVERDAAGEVDGAAVVVRVEEGHHVGAGGVGRGVEVGDEADDGEGLGLFRRQRRG